MKGASVDSGLVPRMKPFYLVSKVKKSRRQSIVKTAIKRNSAKKFAS